MGFDSNANIIGPLLKPYEKKSIFARRYYLPIIDTTMSWADADNIKMEATIDHRIVEIELRHWKDTKFFDDHVVEVLVRDSQHPEYDGHYAINVNMMNIHTTDDFEHYIIQKLFMDIAQFLKHQDQKLVALWEEFLIVEVMGYTGKQKSLSAPVPTPSFASAGGRPRQLDHWKKILETVVSLPCACGGENSLEHAGIHLNDKHKWTRQAIADWMDELHVKGVVDLTVEPINPDRA